MNTTTPEQFAAAYKTNFDTFFSLAHTAFEGMEKLVELNLNAVKANLQESAGKTKDLFAVKGSGSLPGIPGCTTATGCREGRCVLAPYL